jgi:hypothetical protein
MPELGKIRTIVVAGRRLVPVDEVERLLGRPMETPDPVKKPLALRVHQFCQLFNVSQASFYKHADLTTALPTALAQNPGDEGIS